MRDYAQNYRVKQHVAPCVRSRGRVVVRSLRAIFWKTAGGMVVVAMCTGVLASFWIGQQIQDHLTSIATLQQSTIQEQSRKNILIQERDALLSTPQVVARAAIQYGLFPAALKQHVPLRD